MLSDDLTLAVCLRVGDVPMAREMVQARKTGNMKPGEMLKHAMVGDRPGVARMLASEDAIDVSNIECDDTLMKTCNVSSELFACGLVHPQPRTPLERALSAALFDTRATMVASTVMMQAAKRCPDVYSRMLELAAMTPSGPELLYQTIKTCEQAGREDTPATR